MADIIVTDAQGLPDKAYLSFRVGDMRRQMQFKPGCKFKFDGDSLPRHFILDVFERVGTAQVAVADLASSGPGADAEGSVDVVRTNGASMKVSVKVLPPGGATTVPGYAKQPIAPAGDGSAPVSLDDATESKRLVRHQAAVKAKSYLDGHKVQRLLQGMVHMLLEKQPEDPLEFMNAYFQEQSRQIRPQPADQATDEEVHLPDWASQPGLGEDEMPGFCVHGSHPLPDLSKHSSLMANVLKEDPQLYERLSKLKTPSSSTLAKCIKTGIDNRGHAMIKAVGITAADQFCYDVFKDVFKPVINKWHGDWPEEAIHRNDIDPSKVLDACIDSIGGRVLSVEVCAVRNLSGFRMPTSCSREERREVEGLVSQAVANLPSDLDGSYLPLRGSHSHAARPGGMTEHEHQQFMKHLLLFEEPDSDVRLASGLGRHWPDARGIFSNHKEGRCEHLTVWVNEADHIKIFSRRNDADLQKAFKDFARAESSMKASLKRAGKEFAHSPHLGFLSSDPAQIGSGMHVSVKLKLPLLSKQSQFKSLVQHYGLQAHLLVGDREGDGHRGVWEICSADRLGYSEYEQVNTVIEGCKFFLDLEMQLEAGAELDWNDLLKEDADCDHPGFPCHACPVAMPDLSLHYSTMADVLKTNPGMYYRLRSLTTNSGTSLARCIKPGVDSPGHPMIKTVGLVAGCADCYDVFRDLFDPVIQKHHPDVDIASMKHFTDMNHAQVSSNPMDVTGDRILMVSVRMSRNLRGIRMTPACDIEERRNVEAAVIEALDNVTRGLPKGEYFPVRGSESYKAKPFGMSIEDEAMFTQEKFTIHRPDSEVQLSSGFGRDWPDARGIWLAMDRSCAVRVNEEDHLCIVAMQPGQDLKEAFVRACRVHEGIEDGWGFARSSRLGYLAVCPTNIGTCLILNVSVRLPLLSAHSEFQALCKKLKVVARANVGLDLPKTEGVQDISNAERLGSSEVDQVNTVIHGCQRLLELEARLEAGNPIDLDEAMAARQQFSSSSRKSQKVEAVITLAKVNDTMPDVEWSDVPGLGNEPYPGFPADACPDTMPDLSRHFSMMADVLKRDSTIYERLRNVTSASGVSFAQCIKTGIDSPGHPMIKTVGAVVGDAECYETFGALFDPLIKSIHRSSKFIEVGQHTTDLDASKVIDLKIDPTGNHVLDVHIKGQRNIAGIRMLPACSSQDRLKAEKLAYSALLEMPSYERSANFHGEYFPLPGSCTYAPKPLGMNEEEVERLIDEDLFFEVPDSTAILASGSARNWPEARGIFATNSGKFAAWVNEEDHLKLISTEYGGDLKAAFERFCQGEASLREHLQKEGHDFAWNSRLGYLSACPSNLGSGLRVEVLCRLTMLSQHKDWKAMRRCLLVQVRTDEEDAELFHVQNKEKLGSSEVEQVNTVIQACRQLVDVETRLLKGEEVDLLAAQAD